MAAVAITAYAGMLCGCGALAPEDTVVEKSFTDQYGRACTYVLVDEIEEGQAQIEFDVKNIDCDYPPSPSATGGR